MSSNFQAMPGEVEDEQSKLGGKVDGAEDSDVVAQVIQAAMETSEEEKRTGKKVVDGDEGEVVEQEESLPVLATASNGIEEDKLQGAGNLQPETTVSALSDADVAAEASTSALNPEASGGHSELQRLRNLVFASRGTRASLPAGWEDESTGFQEQQESSAPLPTTSVPVESLTAAAIPRDEGVAQRMLQRAISVVGQLASDSDSDSDASSESGSDSDGGSSSLSSSSTSQSAKKKSKKKAEARVVSSDDEEGGGNAHGPTTKNEVLEPTVDPPPYSTVPADREIRPLGKVHSIVDCVVVVAQDVGRGPGQRGQQEQSAYRQAPFDRHGRKGEEEGEYSVLDTGSLLAFSDRNVLGVVYETFGSVLSPLYALRYPSASHVNKNMIEVGKEVNYVPSHSTYVLTRALRALGKGSDASNLWDEEVGEEEREFSDDEAEAAHKKSAKAAKGKGKKRSHPDGGAGQERLPMRQTKHSLPMRPAAAPIHRDAVGANQSIALPYDDDESAPSFSPSATPHSTAVLSPYAQWAQQQQQQQPPQQHGNLPPLRFNGSASTPSMPYYPSPPTSSYYPAPPLQPGQGESDLYDPQQPLFGLDQGRSWPSRPPQ